MSFRPGRAKGPYVGPTGSGGDAEATYVTVEDESGDLSNSSQLADVVLAGQAQQVNDKGADGIEIEGRAYGFHDDFTEDPPGAFWKGTEALKSGDWQRSAGYLEGLAQNNDFDTIRWRIEDEFDYVIDMEKNSASSVGLYLWKTFDKSTYYRLSHTGSVLRCRSDAEIYFDQEISGDRSWIRFLYRNGTLSWQYKLNESDVWETMHTLDAPFASWDSVNLALDSGTSGRIYEVHLHDTMFPSGGYVHHPKSSESSGTTGSFELNVQDANVIDLTLEGDVTLTLPAGKPDQMLILRVRQDATGGHSLAFASGASFSTDLPAPTISDSADAVDYLGFIYSEVDESWHYISEVKGF